MHSRIAVLFLLSLIAFASVHAATGIEDMRSTDTVQGLHEIHEKAREFVAGENANGEGRWSAGEPNLKVFVPRCAVPLGARWDTIRWSSAGKRGEPQEHTRRVIAVTCVRSVDRARNWDVHVPVAPQLP
ncbi:hypothetical protein [Variovorax paradoxus]|uniref:Secreted protein n=1 Tax=Variovorax paradoxus TaxID=34073 RepID=A0A679JUH5_VARPD|nr:hypothetical protein VVAX_06232 [Variovorax paradoxus]